MRYLFQENGFRGRKLLETFPMHSKATIYRHAKLPINEMDCFGRRIRKKGRPRKLTERDERNHVRELRKCRATVGSFSARQLRTDVSLWTIRRALKRHGYSYLHSRKKGLLTQKDLARRNRFARKVKTKKATTQ